MSVPTICGYRSTPSVVFKFCLPAFQYNFIVHDLVRSFEPERLLHRFSSCAGPHESALISVVFPLSFCRLIPCWLSLATANRVGELQAVCFWVAFQGDHLSLSRLPEYVTKTVSERNTLTRSFLVLSLSQCVGDLPDKSLPFASSSHLSGTYVVHFAASSFTFCLSEASLLCFIQERLILFLA